MTALTLIETLSRVMTSWGGTSMVIGPQIHLDHLVDDGIRMISPGPFGVDDPSQAEDHAPLIFVEDPDGRRQKHDDQNDNDHNVSACSSPPFLIGLPAEGRLLSIPIACCLLLSIDLFHLDHDAVHSRPGPWPLPGRAHR